MARRPAKTPARPSAAEKSPAPRGSYLMEGSTEGERLEAKTHPEQVRRRLELVGLTAGMRALDAGAGTGAVARVMAQMVGPSGSVLALDFSAERIRQGALLAAESGLANLDFAVGDLRRPSLPARSFDFVWCEFVFEYLADPDAVLAALADLVAPGGKLVVGDLDGNGMFHYPMPPALESALGQLQRVLQGSFDPYAGRKLYHRFYKLGLVPARVHLLPYHLYAGRIPPDELPNWQAKLSALRPRASAALGGSENFDKLAGAFIELLKSDEALTYSVLFLVEWMRR